MHEWANLRIVDFPDAAHDLSCKRRKLGGLRIVGHLAGAFAPRNGASDRIEHENPAQGELAHAHARRNQRAQFFHRRQCNLVVDTGEGLADIEALALTIEIAMVVGFKLGIGTCP
jgi:hypothetical protein